MVLKSVLLVLLVAQTRAYQLPHNYATRISRFPFDAAEEVVAKAKSDLVDEYNSIDLRTKMHIGRVLDAFRKNRVGSAELNGGLDGYAHGDLGREAIDGIFAAVTLLDSLYNNEILWCFNGTIAWTRARVTSMTVTTIIQQLIRI